MHLESMLKKEVQIQERVSRTPSATKFIKELCLVKPAQKTSICLSKRAVDGLFAVPLDSSLGTPRE